MSNVQEALKAAIEVIEQAIPDKRGEFEEQQKLYENYPNLAYKYDYLKVEADEMQQALDKCKAAIVEIEKCEPFGYFKAEPFGWTDCAETDEGAIALYEAPTVQREGWVSVADAMPNKVCLAYYKNELGNGRTVKAKYVKQYSEEANTDDDFIEYNEADDTYYYPAGWYEMIDNWGDFAFVTINHTVTHWQPLPTAPDKE